MYKYKIKNDNKQKEVEKLRHTIKLVHLLMYDSRKCIIQTRVIFAY